jgi:hypothetical protein
MKTRIILTLLGLTIPAFSVTRAFAVEGGLGRPISGMSIAPFAGVIPPEPGLAVATGETYYEGSTFGLFDLVFTPIVASHHFSETDHLALSFTFWAPTGIVRKRKTCQPEHEHLDVHSRRRLHKDYPGGEH